jgi:UPF0755 protein
MRKSLFVIILAVVVFIGILLWWNNGNAPVNPKDTAQKFFVIPKGTAVRIVGNELKEQGLIRDPVVFFIYVKKNNLDHGIQAGAYKLSPSMNLTQIMDTIRHGTVDIWITLPEGLRAEEIAQILKAEIPSYQESWVEALKAQEGYLFPDTYLIPKDADIDSIISILKNNFYKKIEERGIMRTDPQLSRIVTMASLIEREAITDEEKPMIASVMTNRLSDGIALDIDATLQYAKGKGQNGKWWNVPTSEDKKIPSLYNTYMNPGLPVGPISNPGIEAIVAAKNPARSGYYYYIHDPKGVVHFATTLEEHNKNIEKYLN